MSADANTDTEARRSTGPRAGEAADCIFCKIVARTIPAPLLYEDEHVVAFRDINAQAPQHLLVIPRVHVRNLAELTARGDEKATGHLFHVATQLAASDGLADGGFRLVVNTGPHGGQTVFHLHVHLLGGRHMGWPPG